jgi:hypothetical protein
MFLREVTAQPEWRKYKVVQALCRPGPDGLDPFEKIIRNLDYDSVHQQWACQWDLLEHTLIVMGRQWNPILEAENDPFRKFVPTSSSKSESSSKELVANKKGGGD